MAYAHQFKLSHILVSKFCSLNVEKYWIAQLKFFFFFEELSLVIENVESKILDLFYVSVELLEVKLVLKMAFWCPKIFESTLSSVAEIIQMGCA